MMDKEIVKLYELGNSANGTAEILGVSEQAVRARKRKLGLFNVCKICGADLPNNKMRYCASCKLLKDTKDAVERACPVCGRIFRVSKRSKKYCSKRCADKARKMREHHRIRARNPLERRDLITNGCSVINEDGELEIVDLDYSTIQIHGDNYNKRDYSLGTSLLGSKRAKDNNTELRVIRGEMKRIFGEKLQDYMKT